MQHRAAPDMKNLIIAIVLSVMILGYWEYFIESPRRAKEAVALRAQAHVAQTVKQAEVAQIPATLPKTRDEALKGATRLPIKTPYLEGSLSLKGLRFDDLTFVRYRETLEPTSPEVVLLTPSTADGNYFVDLGWLSEDKSLALPTSSTQWKADAKEIVANKPITLDWVNPQGITFTAAITLDEKYLFTITQSAHDASGKKLPLQTYAYINRSFAVTPTDNAISHEGPLGVFDGKLSEMNYKSLKEKNEEGFEAKQGWLGLSDKYWLTALVPGEAFTSRFTHYIGKGREHYQVEYAGQPQEESTLHLFAGAKELHELKAYGDRYNIALFNRAVDFGWFYPIAQPIYYALIYFYKLVGNFGVAILLLTVVVKAIMFPLANKSYVAMSQMKDLQPKMQTLREKHKEDKLKMNQELMELYKREKINPASGCLPIFIQIPVFFALYKVLYTSIEMRHAPFFGWIHDLSAPDPTNLFTLFGVLHWAPPSFLHLGVWPIIMCATMVVQQSQTPPPADPVQAKVMKMLPFIFLFLFSSFAAGLVIYWSWSNLLSILQQFYITHKHKAAKAKK